MSNRGQGTQRRTLGLLAVLSMFSMLGPGKTKGSSVKHKNQGTSYGGGGRGVRDAGAIYSPKHKKLKGYQKDHTGRKVR